MTGVDRATEEAITALMRKLRDDGATILHATHDLEGAADASDLLCFVNGRIIAFGPPAETLTAETLHATFGGELMIVDAGTHAHVHGGGHHAHGSEG
jgi:ABC-type Mn2+/Zn2+ transport system ATPase subunit